MFPLDLKQQLTESAVVAVLVIDNAKDAVPVAHALVRGGIRVMELTLRTGAALDALRAVREEVPEMVAGMGTILTLQQVDEVRAAGAAFGVAPGLNRRVVEHAQDVGLPFAPGVMTPSDIEHGLELGCTLLKFFPAESSGGLKHLASMAAPYQHAGVEFVPLGGLTADNMTAYLKSPLIAAIGGSWLARREVIAAQNWSTIEESARHARRVADQSRGG